MHNQLIIHHICFERFMCPAARIFEYYILGYISINNRVTLLDLRDEAFYAFNYSRVKKRRMGRLSKHIDSKIHIEIAIFVRNY